MLGNKLLVPTAPGAPAYQACDLARSPLKPSSAILCLHVLLLSLDQ